MRARNMEELIQKTFDMLNEMIFKYGHISCVIKNNVNRFRSSSWRFFVMYHIPRSCDLQRSWGFLDIVRCDLS